METKYIFSFEKLKAWQEARVLGKMIYILTKSFPDNEKFGLISQLRRAVVSVSSNLAEGASRVTKKDQAHFYSVAYSSLMEVTSQLILSVDLEFCRELEINREFRPQVEKTANLINALRNAALNESTAKRINS